MKNFIYFILLIFPSCIDYVKIEDLNILQKENYPPIIDINNISPDPSRLTQVISVGNNCKTQVFKIPPIDEYNKENKLYYLWFFDKQLASPEAIIEPENRASAIISLELNEQFLLRHFNNKIPPNFFNHVHILEFFVSDVPFTIPESHYAKENKKHVDYAYWIITLSNDSC
jgi:hypothetical protein